MSRPRWLLGVLVLLLVLLAQSAAGARVLAQNRAVALSSGSRGSSSSNAARSSIATAQTQQAIRAAARGQTSASTATFVGQASARAVTGNWPVIGWMPLYYGHRRH